MAEPLRPPHALTPLLDAVDAGVLAYDADGVLAAANATAERLLGPVPTPALLDALRDGAEHGLEGVRASRVATSAGTIVTLVDLAAERGVAVAGWLEALHPEDRERFRALAETLPVAAYATDAAGSVQYLNPRWAEITGRDVAASLGDGWLEALHPDDRAPSEERWRRIVAEGRERTWDYRLVRPDGQVRHIVERVAPVRAPDGGVIGFVGSLEDVTERRRAEEQLTSALDDAERRSRIDALTQAFNRRHLTETLVAELARANREGQTPAVILLDIDHFKQVNDRHGHQAGDTVLVEVTRRLGDSIRGYDCLARYGGEEFVVLAPGVPDDEALLGLAEQLRLAVAAHPVALEDGTLLAITASFGAVRAGMGLWSPEGLLDAADRALYAAKRRGRNQCRLFGDLTVEDLAAEEPEAIRLARALALPAGLREGQSERHDEDVADLCGEVARALGLPEQDVLRCRLGGYLHDAGKVAIPDSILAKAGPLDEAEWAVMRRHPELGEEVVRRVAGLSEAAAVVRHHHERWDGTGYPDGLAAIAIPLEARIVAAVDAYCAMTRERVHCPARTPNEALVELHRCAGTQLDPRVVDALCEVLARRQPLPRHAAPGDRATA